MKNNDDIDQDDGDEKTSSTEGVITETAKALGIGSVLPEVYRDLLQPAAREVGQNLLTVARAVTMTLSPLSAITWGFDQMRNWLHATLTARLARTPPEEIVPPPPEISGPVLLHLHFLKDETILRDLFANLLATSMKLGEQGRVHPAFVAVLQQLAPDEALIVRQIGRSSGWEAHESPVGYDDHLHRLWRLAKREAGKAEDPGSVRVRFYSLMKETAEQMEEMNREIGNQIGDMMEKMRNLQPSVSDPEADAEELRAVNEAVSIEGRFDQLCRDAGVRYLDQKDKYLDNCLRLGILREEIHSTAKYMPGGANRYGDWGPYIDEGTIREVVLSSFGEGLIKAATQDWVELDTANQAGAVRDVVKPFKEAG